MPSPVNMTTRHLAQVNIYICEYIFQVCTNTAAEASLNKFVHIFNIYCLSSCEFINESEKRFCLSYYAQNPSIKFGKFFITMRGKMGGKKILFIIDSWMDHN